MNFRKNKRINNRDKNDVSRLQLLRLIRITDSVPDHEFLKITIKTNRISLYYT